MVDGVSEAGSCFCALVEWHEVVQPVLSIDICSLPDISALRVCGFRFGYVTIKWQLTYREHDERRDSDGRQASPSRRLAAAGPR